MPSLKRRTDGAETSQRRQHADEGSELPRGRSFEEHASATDLAPAIAPANASDINAAVGHWADDAPDQALPEGGSVFDSTASTMQASPASQRPEDGGDSEKKPNAILKVVVLSKGEGIQHWTTKAVWLGELPQTYIAYRKGGRWTWDDPAGRQVRVNTNERGKGGQSVESWAKAGDKIVIYAQAIDDVTLDDDAEANDLAPGHAEHEEDAGDGSTNRRSPDGRGRGEGQGQAPSGRDSDGGTGSGASEPGSAGRSTNSKQSGGDSKSGDEEGADSDTHDLEPSEADEEFADELELELGIDPESESGDDDLAGPTEGGHKAGGEGEVGGDQEGRTGDDTRHGGTGPGGEEAREDGDREGSEGGGTGGSQEGSRDGKKGGDPDGMYGGKGKPGDHGVPSAGGVIGLIPVPAALKGAVELALIISDGNITGAGSGLAKRGLGKLASAATARKMIARQARVTAAKETKAAVRHIATNKTSAAAWKTASKAEKAATTRRLYWEFQRRYFDAYLKAAKGARRDASRALRRNSKNAAARAKLRSAAMAEEAATVKPVAGRLPQNHQYAGKQFPADQLPEAYRAKGVKFTPEGYPDFAPHAKTLPNGKKYVEIEYTGSRDADFALANRKAGYDGPEPENFTWHHHEDMKRMYLIPDDLHAAVKHTGGAAAYKHATGIADYGK